MGPPAAPSPWRREEAVVIRQLLAQSPLLAFPLLGLLIFVGVFSVVVARVFRHKADEFDSMARIPLGDDETPRAASSLASEGAVDAATRPALEKGR
jgi:cbb3-type cytochrome oxidase subunit 3